MPPMSLAATLAARANPLVDLVGGSRNAAALVGAVHQPQLWTIMLLVAIVNIVLYMLILNWALAIRRDPKCDCAKDWRLTFCVAFPPLAFVLGIASMMLLVKRPHLAWVTMAMVGAIAAGWLVLIVNAYKYVNGLVTKGCSCATNGMIGDEALQVYASFKVAWSMLILALVGGVGYVAFAARSTHS
jgi:hypothetical protein